MLSVLFSFNAFAGKCSPRFNFKNPLSNGVKAKVLKIKYKVAGKWYTEDLNKVVDSNKTETSSNQRLGGCDDDQKISHVKAYYKLYTKHKSSSKWGKTKVTDAKNVGKRCEDGEVLTTITLK